MFSGIVEEYATLVALVKDQENIHFTFKCSFVNELKIDQSISHNGVCLTVVSLTDDTYTVTAMKETLDRSNLGLLKVGDKVNVERSMMMNGRLDGHIVQGHVDQTATCVEIKDAEGSWYFTFKYAFDKEMAKRGYITVPAKFLCNLPKNPTAHLTHKLCAVLPKAPFSKAGHILLAAAYNTVRRRDPCSQPNLSVRCAVWRMERPQ